MSIKLMTATWELRMPPSNKLVLLALADWANDRGGSCFPSIRRIAERSSISERQAQRYMRALELDGWLTVVGNRAGGRPGNSRHYQIAADRIYATEGKRRTGDTSVTPPMGVPDVTPTGDAGGTQSTINIHQESSSRAMLAAATATETEANHTGVREADFGRVGLPRGPTPKINNLPCPTEVRFPNSGGATPTESRKPGLGNPQPGAGQPGRKRLRTHAPTGAVYWLDDEPEALDTLVEVFGLVEVKKAVTTLVEKGTEPLHGRLRAFLLSQRRAAAEADAMASRRREATPEERAEDARRAREAIAAFKAGRDAPEPPRHRDTRSMEQILVEQFGVKIA